MYTRANESDNGTQSAWKTPASVVKESKLQSPPKSKLQDDPRFQFFEMFTEDEKEALKKSYKRLMNEPKEMAMSVFIKLFQDHPNYKSCFPKLRHLNDMDLINTTELQNHTDLFLGNLRVLIYSLDNPNECFYELERAAIAHEKTNIKRFHVEAMFPILIETLCQSGIVDESTYIVWKKLFDAMNLYQDMVRNGIIKARAENE